MDRLSTGVTGLDTILNGGLISGCAYLIRGEPGQGKTTLGLHFLEAASADEPALFIGFQESDKQLKANAASIDVDVSHVTFLDLSPDEKFFTDQEKYDVFSAAEVESTPLSGSIVETVNRVKPVRVFVDSLTQLRFLAADVFQYRKEVLSMLNFLKSCGATILFSSEHSAAMPDDDLQFLADGVIWLSSGELGQILTVKKMRGSDFWRGEHQMRNGGAGLEVFPRPVPPKEEITENRFKTIATGVDKLDDILNGGLESGTITMVTGPSGVGKSTLASCIAAHSAKTFGYVSVYLFEEEVSSFEFRSKSLAIDLDTPRNKGQLNIEQVEPLRYLADEFAVKVRQEVIENDAKLVVFDSTAGFELTLANSSIKERLHALAKSLSRLNVSVLLVNETASLSGNDTISEKKISYLADNVILMNYVQNDGLRNQVIHVMKKRLSDYDRRPYLYKIGPKSINILDIHRPTGTR
ncbi:MAG: ATPase domain-containing protein [Pseudohongiellaceae bacterium]